MTPQQLTPQLKQILSALVRVVREKQIPEEFTVVWGMQGGAFAIPKKGFVRISGLQLQKIHVEALQSAGLLYSTSTIHEGREVSRTCIITSDGYQLVDSNFSGAEPLIAAAPPVEITNSMKSFMQDHPRYTANCFLMMRFAQTELHDRIVDALRATLEPYNVSLLRSDDKEYHEELYFNILTYAYGCAFGLAVFERIEQEEFNPNVSLEVGLMFGLRKKVCLLKDKTLKSLHTDLVGKLYKPFDPIQPAADIQQHVKTWLLDKGIIILPAS